jgi:NADH:ubiquinone oxidoreductase subunit C
VTPEAVTAALRRAGVEAEPDGNARAAGVRCSVPAARLLETLRSARDELGFDLLSAVTAVDEGDHFRLMYHLVRAAGSGGDPELPGHLLIDVRAPRGDHPDGPVVPSAVPVFAGANLQEREVYDLMGVRFRSHPDLQRVLLWPGFVGHPLRKDYEDVDNEIPWRLAGLRGPDGTPLGDDDARRAEEDAQAWEAVSADTPLASEYSPKSEDPQLSEGEAP